MVYYLPVRIIERFNMDVTQSFLHRSIRSRTYAWMVRASTCEKPTQYVVHAWNRVRDSRCYSPARGWRLNVLFLSCSCWVPYDSAYHRVLHRSLNSLSRITSNTTVCSSGVSTGCSACALFGRLRTFFAARANTATLFALHIHLPHFTCILRTREGGLRLFGDTALFCSMLRDAAPAYADFLRT